MEAAIMAAMNLSKMVGPLPLGAVRAIIAGGLAIAVYTRRQGGGSVTDPTLVDDTSGTPGVGEGGSGQWVDMTPPTTTNTTTAPTTNDEWGRLAINYLIAAGY